METVLFTVPARRPTSWWNPRTALTSPLLPFCHAVPTCSQRTPNCVCSPHNQARPAKRTPSSGDVDPQAKRFQMSVDTAGFRPQDISVHQTGNTVTVKARRHQQCSGGGHTAGCMFRRLRLPDSVQADSVTARLTDLGQLVLEAPLTSKTTRSVLVTGAAAAVEAKQDECEGTFNESTVKQTPITTKQTANPAIDPAPKAAEKEAKPTVEASRDNSSLSSNHGTEDVPVLVLRTEDQINTMQENDVTVEHEVSGEENHEVQDKKTNETSDRETEQSMDISDNQQSSSNEKLVIVGDASQVHSSSPTDQGMFRASADVRDFRPDEVSVKVTGNVVIVEAVHEENSEADSCRMRLLRRVILPKDTSSDLVTSRLTLSGQLIVEVPFNKTVE